MATALLCGALGALPRYAGLARVPALMGVAAALAASVAFEWFQGVGFPSGVAGRPIEWPQALAWLGEPLYVSDVLAGGLGVWCLLAGGLCLLRVEGGQRATWQATLLILMLTALYSLVHLGDLLVMGTHLLFLAMLAWLYSSLYGEEGVGNRHLLTLGLGAMAFVGATLLIGRTTGGQHDFTDLSLATLTAWPLTLIAAFVVLWLGLAPTTGWSAHVGDSAYATLLQALVLGVPVVSLLLRLQALVTEQALAGTVHAEWTSFSGALSIVAGITTLVAGAGTITWAGTARWTGMLTAHALAMALWGMSLDTPLGRFAGVAVLLAYGAARIGMALLTGIRGYPAAGVVAQGARYLLPVAVPFTPVFVGAWLLGAALVATDHPSLVVLLAGSIMLAACGAILHASIYELRITNYELRVVDWVGLTVIGLLLLGGMAPALWLPHLTGMVEIAGGSLPVAASWLGVQVGQPGSGDSALPVLLLALGAALVAAMAWGVAQWARAGVGASSVLLPTGLERIEKAREEGAAGPSSQPLSGLMRNSPPALWWLALAWVEASIWGIARLLERTGAGAGSLLARLEGRYYLPLALILVLVALLVITR